MPSKKEDLETIDKLYREMIINQLSSGMVDMKDASQIVQYLKANEVTSERAKTTSQDIIEKRTKEANQRRTK